jgi:hypothetical protein
MSEQKSVAEGAFNPGKPYPISVTHKSYAEKYGGKLSDIPERLERKEGEWAWRSDSGPASRAIQYHTTPDEKGWLGGFCGAGYWAELATKMETGYNHFKGDEQWTIDSLAKHWYPMPEEVARYVLSLPYRTCEHYWDFFVDFGSEEKVVAFQELCTRYKGIPSLIEKILE